MFDPIVVVVFQYVQYQVDTNPKYRIKPSVVVYHLCSHDGTFEIKVQNPLVT